MPDLTWSERRSLERLLKFEAGFVLAFSNRTFDEFAVECTGRIIYFGEYVKALTAASEIEAEMTERILKPKLSVPEAFNHVRNEQVCRDWPASSTHEGA